jgi:hypothetical protein
VGSLERKPTNGRHLRARIRVFQGLFGVFLPVEATKTGFFVILSVFFITKTGLFVVFLPVEATNTGFFVALSVFLATKTRFFFVLSAFFVVFLTVEATNTRFLVVSSAVLRAKKGLCVASSIVVGPLSTVSAAKKASPGGSFWSAATRRRFQKARLVAPTKALTSQRTPKRRCIAACCLLFFKTEKAGPLTSPTFSFTAWELCFWAETFSLFTCVLTPQATPVLRVF